MILGMDTSSDTMTIALFNEGVVIGEYTTNLRKNHSVRLLPAIAVLMEECGVKPTDLEKIAVAKGPGSYTGLRIGVTVAKTMAWDAGIPIVGISSLALLAENGLYFSWKSCRFNGCAPWKCVRGCLSSDRGQNAECYRGRAYCVN